MSNDEPKKRKPSFSYRPPEALHEEFERRVAESGMSRNAFLTEGWHGRNRVRMPEVKLQARLLRECADIAGFVRKREKADLDEEEKELLQSIKILLLEIRSALFLLMGRKP